MLFVTKIRQDNDMIDHTNVVYAENETKLSCPLGLGTVCDENHIAQQGDQSYRSGLSQNQNRIIGTYLNRCGL